MPRTRLNNQSNDRSVLVDEDYNQVQNEFTTGSSSNYQNCDPENSTSGSTIDPYVSAVQSVSGLPSASLQMQCVLSNENLPHDKKRRVQWAFVLIGISTMLPWNFLITPMNYWNYKFRNTTVNETDEDDHTGHIHTKTPLQTFFASYLSISSNVPFLIMLIILTTVDKRISQDFRTILGLTAISILMMFTTIFVEIDTDAYQYAFMKLELSSVMIMSCFSAILQGAFVSTAACFPSRNMLAYTTGQSIAGILAVVAQIISMSGNVTPIKSGLYYFLTADAVLILTLAVYLSLPKFEYFSFWSKKVIPSDSPSTGNSTSDVSYGSTVESDATADQLTTPSTSFWQAFLAIKWHAIAILNLFWMTMSVFPPLTVLVNPVHPNRDIWSGRFFIPIANFLIFSLSDFVGRLITQYVAIPVDSPRWLALLSVARWLLVPLLMLCNAHPRNHLPVIFNSDAVFIFLILLTGLSNGYLIINAMINGPKYAPVEIRPKVGFVSVLMIGLGVAAGSLTSNFILRLL